MQKTDFVSVLVEGKNNPSKITLAFTMATNAILKGHTTTLVLMLDAVNFARVGAMEGIDIGMPFVPVTELLKRFRDGGGQIAACKSCLTFNGINDEEVDPDIAIITAGDVVDLLTSAKASFQMP